MPLLTVTAYNPDNNEALPNSYVFKSKNILCIEQFNNYTHIILTDIIHNRISFNCTETLDEIYHQWSTLNYNKRK